MKPTFDAYTVAVRIRGNSDTILHIMPTAHFSAANPNVLHHKQRSA